MALTIGSETADTGMSKAIYDEMDKLLSPPLEDAVKNAPDAAKPKAQVALDAARDGWKKLSFAIATGVINHMLSNMEINGIQTQGNISASVSGQTATQNGVIFTQNNNGMGRVR